MIRNELDKSGSETEKRDEGKRGLAVRRAVRALCSALGALLLTCAFTAIICGGAMLAYGKSYYDAVNIDGFIQLARSQDRTTHLYYLSHSQGDGEVAVELSDQALYSSQDREWVSRDGIPQTLADAFIAIEDHRFYEHKGVDIRRTAGAVLGYVTGRAGYGGSTITQQLIKNVTGNDEYSVSRKLREIVFALKLDSALDKDEILELYLNTIYLSDGCYGVQAAAEHYFGHGCAALTPTECAALACIPQSPTRWNPRTSPESNASRRAIVLERMAELGYISAEGRDEAISRGITVTSGKTGGKKGTSGEGACYSWYTEAVIDEALELLVSSGYAVNRQTASKLLYSGGLSIITAQDPKLQHVAEEMFKDAEAFPSVDSSLIQPECSTVVIDHKNGNILAIVGRRGEKKEDRLFDLATRSRRSPGSCIKPLSVYTPALDKGLITYSTVVDDTPYRFIRTSSGYCRPWPQNSPKGYRGLTTVGDAVKRSVNTVSVKILNEMDKEEIFELLQGRLGLGGLVRERDIGGGRYTDIADAPLAHGQLTVGVTVKEITGAYTAIANGGVYHKPKTVLKIFDSDGRLMIDNTDGEGEEGGERVFSRESAAVMTKLLQGVTGGGTASSVKLKRRVECAGKTGTTGADRDRWFIGYTPELLCGVWFGYETPKSLSGFSGSPAVRVWDELMERLYDAESAEREVKAHFDGGAELVRARYCKDSGKLVTAACLADPRGCRVETGYFAKGTEPTQYCDRHVLVRYDTVNHGVAGEDCLSENCRMIGMIRVERTFPCEVAIADAQYVYRPLDGGEPCLSATEPFFYNTLKKGAYPGTSGAEYPFNRFCYHCYFDARATPQDDGGVATHGENPETPGDEQSD